MKVMDLMEFLARAPLDAQVIINNHSTIAEIFINKDRVEIRTEWITTNLSEKPTT